jgi:hypothetical protein
VLPLILLQVSNYTFIKAMRHASTATSPLIRAQLALAAAANGSSSSTAGAVAVHILQQQQQQGALPLLWPSQRLLQAVQQLAEQPLRQLFSQQQQQQDDTAAAAAAAAAAVPSKESRAAGLTRIRNQLLADLRRTGLLPDEQSLLPAAAAAAAGMETEADALRAFDMLQSRVMRQQLLQAGNSQLIFALNSVRVENCDSTVCCRAESCGSSCCRLVSNLKYVCFVLCAC